nr:zinc knuckle CX2CX4HX4C [Tanacetum cinerariifolium]
MDHHGNESKRGGLSKADELRARMHQSQSEAIKIIVSRTQTPLEYLQYKEVHTGVLIYDGLPKSTSHVIPSSFGESLTMNPSSEVTTYVEENVWSNNPNGGATKLFGSNYPDFSSSLCVDSNAFAEGDGIRVSTHAVAINPNPYSHVESTGATKTDQPKDNINFRSLVADKVFDGVNISITQKVVKKVSVRFENTLYGYFIDKRIAFPVVEYYAKNNWTKHGLKRIMMNAKGLFFFKFDFRAGLDAILEGGPWMFRNSPIILKKWSIKTSLQKDELTRILIWVKLHDVPIQVFEEDGISLTATYHGKPIMLDSYTSAMCKNSWGKSSFASNQSSNPTSSTNRNPKGRNRRHFKQKVENSNLEEHSHPVVTMADQRTMAQLLQAPTEGYENAIVVLAITADNFELKHGLLTLIQNKQFFGHDKEDSHAHIHYFNKITSTCKFPNVSNTSIKLMLFFIFPRRCSPDLAEERTTLRNEITSFQQRFDESFSEVWDRFKDLLRACPHHGFSELHQLDTFYNALNSKDQDSLNSAAGCQNQSPTPVKAVEESCVTRGGTHSYRNCPATNGNVYRDNIQEFVSQAFVVNYNQGNPGYRPPGMANQIRRPGFAQPNAQNNRNRFGPPQGFNRGNNFNPEHSYQAPAQQNQNVHLNELKKVKRMNEANMKAMQTQIDMGRDVANPKGELKAITTRNGLVIDGPIVPTPPQSINLEVDDRVEESFTNPDLAEYTIKKMLKALLSNKEKLQELANTPLNENCSAVILKKLPKKLRDPRKFLILCGFSELKCKALADLGASIKLMPLSVWKKLGLPKLIPTRMTLELANRAICTPAEIARDVFVLVGKFIFPADFVIVDYESDPRVHLIFGRPFLRTARALIDVHSEEMIIRDGDERLTLNMRHDTSSYSNQPHKESINLINVFNNSSEDFLKDLFSNQPSGNPTFLPHHELTSPKVNNDIFDLEGCNVLSEKLLDLDSTKDLHPPLHDNPLKVEFDAENVYDDSFDSKGEKIKESKLLINELDLPCDFIPPFEYDSFISQDFSRVDAFPSTNNEDKIFNQCPCCERFSSWKDFAFQPRAPKAGSNGGGTCSEVSSKAGSSKNTKEGAYLTKKGAFTDKQKDKDVVDTGQMKMFNITTPNPFTVLDNYHMDRSALWSNLAGHAGLMRNRPWVLMGDFNAALNLEDHSFGGYEPNVAMRDFKDVSKLWRFLTSILRIGVKLDEAQKAIDEDPSSSILREEHAHYLLAFKEAQLDEERFLKQKAKVEWLKAGDSNTTYFHRIMKSKCARKRIDMVSDSSNTLYDGNQDVTDIEVKNVIFSMGDDKAPGPNGFTAAFFKKAWDVVGGDITCAIRDFFLQRKLIANRVKEGLGDIVSINQSTFVPGRRISDNILLTKELMRNYHRRRGPPRCAFKVDIQKAYDTIDWEFLETILIGFGFHLKMGDPLSPYLFTLVMEVLTLMLQRRVSGLSIPKSTSFLCNVPNAIKASILNSLSFSEGALLKGKAKVAWDSVCMPKHEGCLGIRRIDDFNVALMDTHIWSILTHKESLWVKWIHMYKLNGRNFWDVPCRDVCPLKDMLSNRDITILGFSLDDSVINLISDGVWRWPLDWLSRFPSMAQLQVPMLLDDMDDVILWLRQWNVGSSIDLNLLGCPLCGLVPDSHDHVFFECSFSVHVWFKVRALCGIDCISPWLSDVMTFIVPISKGKTSILSRIVVVASSYYIWLELNGRLFKKRTSSPDQIVQVILSIERLKLVTFKFKKMSTRSRLLLD